MSGLVYVNKPKDYTSRDIVNLIGKKLKTKKVGHTGTLDPMATGVLIIALGRATKLTDIITSEEKEYLATITLGIKTDTADITGKVLEEETVNIKEDKIKEILETFIGTYDQEVPIYSAVKVKGKKLYEYARNNETVELPKKPVTIKKIELSSNIKYEDNKTIFDIKCTVSKGTYIRSLITDIASRLNTIGVMSSLVRLKQGNIHINECINIDDIEKDNIIIHDVKEVLNMNTITVDEKLEEYILNGRIIDNKYETPVLFQNKNNELLAIYKIYDKDNTKIKPWVMLKEKING